MLIDWPEVNQDNPADRVWADVARHNRDWRSMAVSGDLVSTAHECTHGVNADIRNAGHPAGLYLLAGKALACPEPSFRKSVVADYVPASLRGDRFATYVTGQPGWDDSPLYIWDEWTAYQNGAIAAADLSQHSEYVGGWSDWAMGPLEFNAYGLAVMAAARQHDPKGYAALRDDFATLWIRGWDAHQQAAKFFPWDKQDAYARAFLEITGPLADTAGDLGIDIPTRDLPIS